MIRHREQWGEGGRGGHGAPVEKWQLNYELFSRNLNKSMFNWMFAKPFTLSHGSVVVGNENSGRFAISVCKKTQNDHKLLKNDQKQRHDVLK